jgi:hypothetical protein
MNRLVLLRNILLKKSLLLNAVKKVLQLHYLNAVPLFALISKHNFWYFMLKWYQALIVQQLPFEFYGVTVQHFLYFLFT